MSSLIARIKARVADPILAVDAATWVEPMPTVDPPAAKADIDAAEAALGFAIPPLLRRLYLEIGNGGFGPEYGLEGVPAAENEGRADIVALYESYVSELPEWPYGLVPLIGRGCNIVECVSFIEPPYPVLLFDPDRYERNRPLIESLIPIVPSLEDRLEAWLAGEELT